MSSPSSLSKSFTLYLLGLLLLSLSPFLLVDSRKVLEPPRRLHGAGHVDSRKLVAAGSSVALPCPVEKSEQDVFIDWFKDGDLLSGIDSRIRKTNGGTLRVKEVTLDDTGFYLCRAINGFGSVEIGVNLIVLENDLSDSNNTGFDFDATRPRLTQVSSFAEQVIQRPAGSSIKFKCEASGHPRPSISWFYNHHLLQTRDAIARRGRWTLLINDLKVEDSGNYTCFVVNIHGNTSASFVLEVTDEGRNKPELTGLHPANTTVKAGQPATFHCQVKSDVIPHIQWLKKIDSSHVAYNNKGHDELASTSHIINVEGDQYRVLKSGQMVEEGAGSYVNKLVIEDTRESDSGNYVCLGANSMGYRHRSAFLTVIPQTFSPQLINPPRELFLPAPIIVASVGVLIMVLVSTGCLLLHCRNQKRSGSTGSPTTETSSSRTGRSNSPCHQLASKVGKQQQQHLFEQPTRRPSPFGAPPQPHLPGPHHHYSPIHSAASGPHSQPYSPVPSTFVPHPPNELTHPTHHHALLTSSEKNPRSSSVSPAFPGQNNVQYHQYYHIPQRTSYGYLC